MGCCSAKMTNDIVDEQIKYGKDLFQNLTESDKAILRNSEINKIAVLGDCKKGELQQSYYDLNHQSIAEFMRSTKFCRFQNTDDCIQGLFRYLDKYSLIILSCHGDNDGNLC
jgi:hypothetical protein